MVRSLTGTPSTSHLDMCSYAVALFSEPNQSGKNDDAREIVFL
jgi:hypothetical protein